MTAQWHHRHIVIVSASDRDAANAVAVEVTGNPADNLTFGVPLSATGTGSPTHYGCSSAAMELHRERMAVRLAAGRVPSVRFWRLNADTGVLTQTNVTKSQARVGQVVTWEQALLDAGLKVIQPAVLP